MHTYALQADRQQTCRDSLIAVSSPPCNMSWAQVPGSARCHVEKFGCVGSARKLPPGSATWAGGACWAELSLSTHYKVATSFFGGQFSSCSFHTLEEEQGVGEQILLDALLGHLLQQQVYNALLCVHRLLVQLLCHLVHHLPAQPLTPHPAAMIHFYHDTLLLCITRHHVCGFASVQYAQ